MSPMCCWNPLIPQLFSSVLLQYSWGGLGFFYIKSELWRGMERAKLKFLMKLCFKRKKRGLTLLKYLKWVERHRIKRNPVSKVLNSHGVWQEDYWLPFTSLQIWSILDSMYNVSVQTLTGTFGLFIIFKVFFLNNAHKHKCMRNSCHSYLSGVSLR